MIQAGSNIHSNVQHYHADIVDMWDALESDECDGEWCDEDSEGWREALIGKSSVGMTGLEPPWSLVSSNIFRSTSSSESVAEMNSCW